MNKPTNPKNAVSIGKVSVSSIPVGVLLEVATAMFEGASKYGRHNYRHTGVRASVYYDATMRHMVAWWEGEDIDDASSLSHITKAISSLVVLRDAMLNDMLTDDRPPRPKVQIGKHIESLNEICASLIERHKGADVTHYTHESMQAYNKRMEPVNPITAAHPDVWDEGEKRMNNIARSHGDGEHYDAVETRCTFCGRPHSAEHSIACDGGPRPTFDESANFDPTPFDRTARLNQLQQEIADHLAEDAETVDMSDPKNWEPGDIVADTRDNSACDVNKWSNIIEVKKEPSMRPAFPAPRVWIRTVAKPTDWQEARFFRYVSGSTQ